MNNRKIKGLPKRLLALMLCCFWLVMSGSAAVSALQEEEVQIEGEAAVIMGNGGSGDSGSTGDKVDPDEAFIWVTKTFVGIDEIPSDFSITVDGAEYTANSSNVKKSKDSDGNTVLRWKISVTGNATYTVKESGAEVRDYTLTADPAAVLTETGASVSVDASQVTVKKIEKLPSCSEVNFTLAEDEVFIIAAKRNVIVISAAPLGMAARTAIIEEIKTFSGDYKHNNGATVFFYEISQYAGQTISIGGTDVTLNADGTLATIGATREWTKAMRYSYSFEAAQSDISITNTYKLKVCDLTITKTVGGNMGDRNKEFSFTAKISGEGYSFEGATYSIDGGAKQSAGNGTECGFTLKHDQSITFHDLPVGARFEVTEGENTYVTTVDGESGTSKTITLALENDDIDFVNKKNITIDNGVLLDTLPYVLILCLVVVGAVLMIKKRRRRDD